MSSTPSKSRDDETTRIYNREFEVSSYLSAFDDEMVDPDRELTRPGNLTPHQLELLRGYVESEDDGKGELPSASPSPGLQNDADLPAAEMYRAIEEPLVPGPTVPTERPARRQVANWVAFTGGIAVCACGLLLVHLAFGMEQGKHPDHNTPVLMQQTSNFAAPVEKQAARVPAKPAVALVPSVTQLVAPAADGKEREAIAQAPAAQPPEKAIPVAARKPAAPATAIVPAKTDERAPQAAAEPEAAKSETPAEASALEPTADVVSETPLTTGVLRINARPWADIYIDGKLVGHTPLTHLELGVGVHQVSLKNRRLNLQKNITVEIAAGEVETRVVDMQRGSEN